MVGKTAGQTANPAAEPAPANRLATSLCGVVLDNPIIPASGTFGYGREFAALYDIRMLGSFSFKAPRFSRGWATPAPASPSAPAAC